MAMRSPDILPLGTTPGGGSYLLNEIGCALSAAPRLLGLARAIDRRWAIAALLTCSGAVSETSFGF
ncbi:MAG: hypothetical protein KGO96_10100 [Elusimicrobia bacterium]|nr:hypothetical protein [Elusimicrobiota bacterium]